MATSAKSKGPQLTQRKIDKLRDALNVVWETDQVQLGGAAYGNASFRIRLLLDTCDEMEHRLKAKKL